MELKMATMYEARSDWPRVSTAEGHYLSIVSTIR